ncbi:MAG: sigma-70 family RNA polymerase sigma factor [Deltaproteobacteria bacterium]|nr:sigma-70 family RNA polymerase sigma factor [Deltaproteobacteria bacterium]
MHDRVATIEDLHRRYAGVLFDKSLRMLGDHGEAENAVQETFINAFRALHRFHYGDSHLPWLYRICTNACLKIIRTNKRKGAIPVDVLPERGGWDGRGMDRQLQLRRTLQDLMEELDDRTMTILVAHHIDGLDQGQVAKQVGISRRAVVKRLTALRAKLGTLMEDVDV